MLNTQGLESLFQMGVGENAPSFIIYSSLLTNRLNYSCSFIFNTVLKVNYSVTNDLREFENSEQIKINYSLINLPGIVQVIPHSLLFEKGVSELKPKPFHSKGMIYFYKNETAADENFHFDVFSAVFYFISRSEEWQNFEKDKHGRFEAKSAVLFGERYHLKPVVDIWILEFRDFLEAHIGSIRFPQKQFKIISSIDVDNLFAYRKKGLMRTVGAGFKDLLKLDLKNLRQRWNVLAGKTKDPFDIYETVSEYCLQSDIPLLYFFLLRSGTEFDRTVDPASGAFKNVFNVLKSKKALIGLHPSYWSAFENGRLALERELISGKLGEPVSLSRQHFLRFDIRTTPNLLSANGIKADFSMGFASSPGFRAGTSHPFLYYDFSAEKCSDLLLVPFCTMDGAYFIYNSISPEAAFESMYALAQEIKKTNGFFISVFHERTFSNHLYPGFGTLYKILHQRLKEL